MTQLQVSQDLAEADVVAPVNFQVSQQILEVDVPPADPAPEIPPTVTASPDPQGKRLGCGDYRVFLQSQGGDEQLLELDWTSLSFGRALDDMTSAQVSIGVDYTDADCLAVLANLKPWATEIAIWRDDVEVWVGPVLDPVYGYETMSLECRDMFAWLERRWQPTSRTLTADVSDIAMQLVRDAMGQDPTPNLEISAAPTGVTATRTVNAAMRERCADIIRELARTGLDFTVIARRLRFGGEEIPTDPIADLIPDHFDIAEARPRGLTAATHVTIIGTAGSSAGAPVAAEAGGIGAIGLVQQTFHDSGIEDASSAQASADNHVAFLSDPPLYVSGRLLEDAPVAFSDLIPGARVGLAQQVGYRSIDADMRLQRVDVRASSAANGVTEDVLVVLTPLGEVEG